MTGHCSACGCEVNFRSSRFQLPRIFCGKSCYDSVRRLHRHTESAKAKVRAVQAQRRAALTPNVTCSGCGTRFYRPPCEVASCTRHFCSMTCRRKQCRGTCSYCGTEIVVRAGRSDRPRYCSHDCNSAARRKPFVIKNGYRLVLQKRHRRADSYGYVREHIVVMEGTIGRALRKREEVHHRNGDKQDNRPENLMLFASHREHMKEHAQRTQSGHS